MPGVGVPGGDDEAGRKICAGCGAANEASSSFCYRCGLRLPSERAAPGALVRPAGFWVRFGAWVIDQLLLGIAGSVVLLAFWGLPSRDGLGALPAVSLDQWLASFCVEAAYWTFTIGRWGKSVGKALLQIKVVRADGGRVSYSLALGRYLAFLVSWLTLGIGFVMIAVHPRKRALHDLIAGTRVITD